MRPILDVAEWKKRNKVPVINRVVNFDDSLNIAYMDVEPKYWQEIKDEWAFVFTDTQPHLFMAKMDFASMHFMQGKTFCLMAPYGHEWAPFTCLPVMVRQPPAQPKIIGGAQPYEMDVLHFVAVRMAAPELKVERDHVKPVD